MFYVDNASDANKSDLAVFTNVISHADNVDNTAGDGHLFFRPRRAVSPDLRQPTP
jgi:hypothetical protein